MLDGYSKNASDQLEHDQQLINELTLQLKAHLYEVCKRNTSPGAKPKSSDSKTNIIYKCVFRN